MGITLDDAPIPLNDPIAKQPRAGFEGRRDPQAGRLTSTWVDYFGRLTQAVSANPTRLNHVRLSAQVASVAATDFSGGGLNDGLFRLTYYARITQAAGTSSSLTVTFSWTEGGVSLALAGTAMTGNLTTTVQSGSVTVRVDSASPVRYATTYASSGSPVMQYGLDVVIEEVKA